MNIDPLTEERLSNILSPTFNPHFSPASLNKIMFGDEKFRNLSISIIGALSSWGHLTYFQLEKIIMDNHISKDEIRLCLNSLYLANIISKFVDCPTCREIEIYGLKSSPSFKKMIKTMSSRESIYALGEKFSIDNKIEDFKGLTSTPKTNKHDITIAELSRRITDAFENSMAFGAKYTSCSSLLRNKKPDGARPWHTTKFEIERWADSLILFFNNNTRLAIEMGLSQSIKQIANKARWWGFAIAYRGGYEKCGLRVLFVDPPWKRDHSKKAIESSLLSGEIYLGIAGEDNIRQSLLHVNWEDWIKGNQSPFIANGMEATDMNGTKVLLATEQWDNNWTGGMKKSLGSGLISGSFGHIEM